MRDVWCSRDWSPPSFPFDALLVFESCFTHHHLSSFVCIRLCYIIPFFPPSKLSLVCSSSLFIPFFTYEFCRLSFALNSIELCVYDASSLDAVFDIYFSLSFSAEFSSSPDSCYAPLKEGFILIETACLPCRLPPLLQFVACSCDKVSRLTAIGCELILL